MTLEPWEIRLRVLLMETTRASDGVDFIPGTIWTTCLITPCNMYLYIRSVIFQSTCMFEVTCYTAPNNDVQLKLTNTTLSIMRPSPRYRAMFRTQLQQWRPRLEDHWFQYKVYGSKIIRYLTVIVRHLDENINIQKEPTQVLYYYYYICIHYSYTTFSIEVFYNV